MNIIKLNAIDSTSSFLKEMAKNTELVNYTVVTAEEQSAGRGQMGTTWVSKPGENLLFTLYVDIEEYKLNDPLVISYLVALSLLTTIQEVLGEGFGLTIKWPNDIMSRNKKIAGILIENRWKNNLLKDLFIGIGLNVHQVDFNETLYKASSLKKISNKEFDKDLILENFVNKVKQELLYFKDGVDLQNLKERYLKNLYRFQKPSMFKTQEKVFLGKIIGVDEQGRLLVMNEDDSIVEYALKEITFL